MCQNKWQRKCTQNDASCEEISKFYAWRWTGVITDAITVFSKEKWQRRQNIKDYDEQWPPRSINQLNEFFWLKGNTNPKAGRAHPRTSNVRPITLAKESPTTAKFKE